MSTKLSHLRSDAGFTLPELLMSTTIMLIVLAAAMTSFKNVLGLNQAASLIADSNQNLRAGTNLLVRDLMQAGRGIPTGGIPIPNAGATPINRPSPPGLAYTFDNTTSTTLPAVIPGAGLGPTIDGQTTDIITMLAVDPTALVQPDPAAAPMSLPINLPATPPAWPAGVVSPSPTLASDGASMNVGQFTSWITDPINGIKAGDLLMFTISGQSAIQTVTSTNGTDTINFAQNDTHDWFNFNQRGATGGSIMQIQDTSVTPAVFRQGSVDRVTMLTYYVDNVTTPGTPRLVRMQNHFTPQALAGVVEDLDMAFDLYDGATNPTNQKTPVAPLTANQIRKVNLHVGVRSDTISTQQNDYLRNHLSTIVSIRNLAFVDRYK